MSKQYVNQRTVILILKIHLTLDNFIFMDETDHNNLVLIRIIIILKETIICIMKN